MDTAMSYEIFIRGVFQVGRYGVDGANADDWRDLEMARDMYLTEEKLEIEGQSKQRTTPAKKLKKEYEIELEKVSEYVRGALRVLEANFKLLLSLEERKEIERCKALASAKDYDKLKEAILSADKILLSKKIFPK